MMITHALIIAMMNIPTDMIVILMMCLILTMMKTKIMVIMRNMNKLVPLEMIRI